MPPKKGTSTPAVKVIPPPSRRSQRINGPSPLDSLVEDKVEPGTPSVLSLGDVLEGRVQAEVLMDDENAGVFGWERVPNDPSAGNKYVASIDGVDSFEEARFRIWKEHKVSMEECHLNRVSSLPSLGSQPSGASGHIGHPASGGSCAWSSGMAKSPSESVSEDPVMSSSEKVSALHGLDSAMSEVGTGLPEVSRGPKVYSVDAKGLGSSFIDRLQFAVSENGSPERASSRIGREEYSPASQANPLFSRNEVNGVNDSTNFEFQIRGTHATGSDLPSASGMDMNLDMHGVAGDTLLPGASIGPTNNHSPAENVGPTCGQVGPPSPVTLPGDSFKGVHYTGPGETEMTGKTSGPGNIIVGPDLSAGVTTGGPIDGSHSGPAQVDDSVKPCENANLNTNPGIKFGSFTASLSPPTSPKFVFDYDKFLTLDDGGPDISIMGSKLWNQDLFQKLVSGHDIEDSETRLLYEPPQVDQSGEKIVRLNGHFMAKCTKAYSLHLYGYFVGTTLPFFLVKQNLIRMWHQFGLQSITRNNAGYYFFRFGNEDGMYQVLQRGPWLVNDVPLIVRLWEPDACLAKPDPSMVPIWVSIMNLPLSLWNGGNISQIVSCIGRPIMLDKPTFERCQKKEGVVGFARVLVLALAQNGLPDRVKVQFPSRWHDPGKVCYFDLSYNWKPPICTHCHVFGHDISSCLVTKVADPPITQQLNILNDVPLVQEVGLKESSTQQIVSNVNASKEHKENNGPVDDFITVTRRKKGRPKAKPPMKSIWQHRPNPQKISHDAGPSKRRDVHFVAQPSPDKGRAHADISEVNATIPISNVFNALNDVLHIDDDIPSGHNDGLLLGESDKAKADSFIKFKTLPPKALFAKWPLVLKGYFLSLCKQNGLDPTALGEGEDVLSEDDGTGRFMAG
jgi:hypothetical protein